MNKLVLISYGFLSSCWLLILKTTSLLQSATCASFLEDQETELLIKGSKVSQSNQKNRCLTNHDNTDNEIKGRNSQVSAS